MCSHSLLDDDISASSEGFPGLLSSGAAMNAALCCSKISLTISCLLADLAALVQGHGRMATQDMVLCLRAKRRHHALESVRPGWGDTRLERVLRQASLDWDGSCMWGGLASEGDLVGTTVAAGFFTLKAASRGD